jgi:hypothetical protein
MLGEFGERPTQGMDEGTARLWKEGARWAIQIEIDGVPYTERDYADAASAIHAIASILRAHAERVPDLDQEACASCDAPLELSICSQCGASAFVRTCGHGALPPIRLVDGSAYCCACRA